MSFQNTLISRLSSAEKSDHLSFMSATLTKSSYFLRTYDEYYQGSSNALSTVFVLLTVFLMPFQNTLISRLSSAEKCDHFPFISGTLSKCFYFLRTYVNIIKVLAMRLSTVFVSITDFLMPFQNTLISRLSSPEKRDHFSLMSASIQNLPIF